MKTQIFANEKKPRVIIVGAGFGGLEAAKALRQGPVEVLLLDRHNYHLFQPLLYQVATAGISPNEIAYPVRSIFRRQPNFQFRMTDVLSVDLDQRRLQTSSGPLDYDYLILSPGGSTNFFGLRSVEEHGFAMKNLDEAITLRNHILRQFELAAQTDDPAESQALRTFVVVGGGPTGVEFAGALSELIRLVLVKDYRGLDFSHVSVLLLEASGHLLAGFPEDLAEAALKNLEHKHVTVRLNAAVTGYDGRQVQLKTGEMIPARTLLWAAGVRAESLLGSLGLPQARQGRVAVTPALQAPGHPEVFIIGDGAYLEDHGQPLPMMAPVAIQQGKLAARNVLNHLQGRPLENFVYKDPGSLATIGRNAAVARVKGFKFSGFLAWLVWLGVHLFWLIGFRNRLLVLINWAWDYLLYDRAVRVITDYSAHPEQLETVASAPPQVTQPAGNQDGRIELQPEHEPAHLR